MTEEKKEVQEEVTPAPVETQTTEETDDRGVSWKNVAMENERKLKELTDRLSRIEASYVPPNVTPMPNYQTPDLSSHVTNRVDPTKDLEDMVGMGPTTWYKKMREQERQQELQAQQQKRSAEARAFIASKGTDKYNENYTKVLAVVDKYNLNAGDPLVAVQNAFRIIELEEQKDMSAREKQLQEEKVKKEVEEKSRTNAIKKTQAVGGAKPPAPKNVSNNTDALDAVRQKGDERSAKDYFRQNWFNSDK